MKSYVPLDWLLEQAEAALPPEKREAVFEFLYSAPHVELPEDGILSVRSAIVCFDSVETYPDCTVQVPHSSDTGETSIGWWRNDSPPSSL